MASSQGAYLLPHPTVVWEQIRTMDVLFLLTLGAVTELIFRGCVLAVKRKPGILRKKEEDFFKIEYETQKKRQLGPPAFVECSKLERQLLAADKELQQLYQDRQAARENAEKIFLKYGRNLVAFLVFVVYYGVPVLSFSGGGSENDLARLDETIPAVFQRAVMFPLSIISVGFRMSKWGMDEGIAATSIGALVVMWAGSSFVGQIMDGLEHLLL